MNSGMDVLSLDVLFVKHLREIFALQNVNIAVLVTHSQYTSIRTIGDGT